MSIKSNVALSYIAMLSVVGFFLWVIRNFVRGLRQKDQPSQALPLPPDADVNEKRTVCWAAHVYIDDEDDIPIPGTIKSVTPSGAFMESSACLATGQEVTLYVDVDQGEQLRLSAHVTWARTSRDGRNAAQLVFPASEGRLYKLHSVASSQDE